MYSILLLPNDQHMEGIAHWKLFFLFYFYSHIDRFKSSQ